MGCDVGDKRIGIAVTDPFGWTVQPLRTIVRKNLAQTLGDLDRLLEEYTVATLVLGLPLNSKGEEGPQAAKVRLFERQLKNHIKKTGKSVTIAMWDESFTTQEAAEELIAADVSRKKRRAVIDKLAAQRILESYLASLKDMSS